MRRTVAILAITLSVIVPVGAGQTTASTGGRFARHEVRVFYTRESSLGTTCSRLASFGRRTVGADVLNDAMNALLKGPTRAERRAGVVSFFSKKTAGMVNSVSVQGSIAQIDFDDMRKVIPNASSSCGSASLLAELDATARQFPTVDRTIYSLEGSRRAFYNWLQMEPLR